jgi:hypothetical protein
MYATRIPAIGARMRMDPRAPRGAQMSAPAEVRWKADNYNHLYEQPTLFYAVAIALAVLGDVSWARALAWTYVGIRVVHSFWQALSNQIMVRFATSRSRVECWCCRSGRRCRCSSSGSALRLRRAMSGLQKAAMDACYDRRVPSRSAHLGLRASAVMFTMRREVAAVVSTCAGLDAPIRSGRRSTPSVMTRTCCRRCSRVQLGSTNRLARP